MKILYSLVLIILLIGFTFAQQPIFEENFDYVVGTNLTALGWTAHSAAGTNSIQVISPGLIYTGYPGTGIGNAAGLNGSGEDVNRNFTEITSDSVYASFMVNVSSATTDGTYFFHLGPTSLGFIYSGKVFVNVDASNNLAFGVSKRSSSSPVYSSNVYALNTTYLIIMKYLIKSGTQDDEASLFVFTDPTLPGTEPQSPTVGPATDTSDDPSNLGTVALRQGSASTAPTLVIDGIRIGTTWESVTSGTSINPPVISNVLVEPFPADLPIDITCDVTIATGSIDSVKLFYYTDLNLNNLDSIPMLPTVGDQFSATLTALQNGTSLIYWVKAWGNTVTAVSSQNKVIIGIPDISMFHTQLDTLGLPLHLNHLTRLKGIVTVSTGVFETEWYDFYMQDNTGGINVFSFDTLITAYNEGDSLVIVGLIDAYNGKVELTDFQVTVLSTGNLLMAPMDVNIEDMGETYEGRFISIDNVNLAAGSNPWPTTLASTTLTITDGTGELAMRIVDSTHIGVNPEPNWPITVVGIGNQFDTSSPYFEGYQIQPRSYSDLISTGIDDKNSVPLSYSLRQNYPNPFNPVSTIPYSLKKAGRVHLRIYNILGEEVYSFSQKQAAGKHTFTFNAQRFSSGIYFYQLEAGDFKAVRKMILTK